MEDKLVLMIISAIPVVLFIVLGIVFINGKGVSLIAGYNSLPAEEKKKYDTAALCKFVGKMMFALSFCTLLWLLSAALEISSLFSAGLVLFVLIIVYMIIHLNTGNRYKKDV